jgi:hypothetical protein
MRHWAKHKSRNALLLLLFIEAQPPPVVFGRAAGEEGERRERSQGRRESS